MNKLQIQTLAIGALIGGIILMVDGLGTAVGFGIGFAISIIGIWLLDKTI